MYSALDDVEFLARSESRVEVLSALGEGPRTRDELKGTIDASRVTLDRTLDGLEDRGWIVRTDGRYESTPPGEFIGTEIRETLSHIETTSGSPGASQRSPTDPSVDGVGFLARSRSRVEALDALRESPRTRRELEELTGTSRATLSRILGELEDRWWIERTNGRYESTPPGREAAATFTRLLSNVAAAEALEDVMGWLPVDEFGFDLACLDDAEVIAADRDDPTASIHRVAELVREADRARIAGPGAAREVIAAIRDLTTEHGGTFEGVVDTGAIETVQNDGELRDHFRAIMESGRATIARHEGGLPFFVVTIIDDTVVLCGDEDRGAAHEAVETDDEQVRTWAESHFEAIMADAHPLELDGFTP